MRTYVAEIGEIVRAQRRDEEEISQLAERLSNAVRGLAGERIWMQLYSNTEVLSKLAYYSATLLAGAQTLGEEYLNVFESAGLTRSMPAFSSRFLFITIHVFSPLMTAHVLRSAESRLLHPSTATFCGFPIHRNLKARSTFLKIVQAIRTSILPALQRIHLAVFYIYGAYYNFSRRFANLRYISFNAQTDIQALKVYKLLGYITLVQCALSSLFWIGSQIVVEANAGRAIKSVGRQATADDLEVAAFSCGVCLEHRPPAAAPCGHTFCWYCLQEGAMSDPARCPSCRAPCEPRQITPLLNF